MSQDICCEIQQDLGDIHPLIHDVDCENYDGAPVEQWQVTTPEAVYATDDE